MTIMLGVFFFVGAVGFYFGMGWRGVGDMVDRFGRP